MLKIIFTLGAAAAILASGFVHGVWTERWGRGEAPRVLGLRLDQLPMQIGDWDGQDDPQSASILDRELAGSLQRRYTHAGTGQSVTIAILCGRPGPICIHTPDVCYGASGYEVGRRSQVKVSGRDDEFWLADAVRTRSTETTRLRILWAWSHGQGWLAAHDPRADFARQPALLKLYVLRDLAQANEKVEGDACVQFLQAFVPEAQRALFSSAVSE